jgi:hypothetical protein
MTPWHERVNCGIKCPTTSLPLMPNAGVLGRPKPSKSGLDRLVDFAARQAERHSRRADLDQASTPK